MAAQVGTAGSWTGRQCTPSASAPEVHTQLHAVERPERTHEHHYLVVRLCFALEVGNGVILPRQEVDRDGVLPPCGQHKPLGLQASSAEATERQNARLATYRFGRCPGRLLPGAAGTECIRWVSWNTDPSTVLPWTPAPPSLLPPQAPRCEASPLLLPMSTTPQSAGALQLCGQSPRETHL